MKSGSMGLVGISLACLFAHALSADKERIASEETAYEWYEDETTSSYEENTDTTYLSAEEKDIIDTEDERNVESFLVGKEITLDPDSQGWTLRQQVRSRPCQWAQYSEANLKRTTAV